MTPTPPRQPETPTDTQTACANQHTPPQPTQHPKGNTPTRHPQPVKSRARLSAYSARRKRDNQTRKKVLARAHGPQPCARPGCGRVGTEPHEPLTRARGGSITDPDNIRWLCHWCHVEVTAEAAWAYETDPPLLVHSWDRQPLANGLQPCTVANMPSPMLSVRISPAADDWVNLATQRHGCSRTDVVKAMLSVATHHPDEVNARLTALIAADAIGLSEKPDDEQGRPVATGRPAPKPSRAGKS